MHPKEIEIDGNAYPLDTQQNWIDVIAQLDAMEPSATIMLKIPSPAGGSWYVRVTPATQLRYYYPAKA